ncbi:MAG: hypothetical protein AAB440_02585 [Patescibacteria group bacterium]
MKRKGIERVQALIAELDSHEDINGVDTFYSREGQQTALRHAKDFLEKLKQALKTPEDAKKLDGLLVEYTDKVRRIEKAGERIERLRFSSEEEKTRAIEKLELLLRRIREAPVVEE